MKISTGKVFLSISAVLLTILAVIYFLFLFALPEICNSRKVRTAIVNKINETYGINLKMYNFRLNTYPNLTSDIHIGGLRISNKDSKPIFTGEEINVTFAPVRLIPEAITVDYLFFDKPAFDELNIKPKPKAKKEAKFKHIPYINLRKSDIVLFDNEKHQINALIEKLNLIPDKNKFMLDTDAKLVSKKWNNNYIKLKGNGYLIFNPNNLSAENYKISVGDADVKISGELYNKEKGSDFNITADNLSIKYIQTAFLATMKYFKPNEKNFIENFYDFSGRADFDLNISKKGITGTIQALNLAAKTVKFSIPVIFPDAKFYFTGNGMNAEAEGLFGNEKVYSDIKAVDMFNKTRVVTGHVKSDLGSKFAKKYVPHADITNKIKLSLKYVIQNQKPLVDYWAEIPIGSNMHYRGCDLGLLNEKRRVYAQTLKDGDNMILQTYDYSVVKDNSADIIITGNGLFKRKDAGSKFHLDYITGKTDGDAPVSLTGSFGKYVKGGTFNGDLKYHHDKGIITGSFNLKNTNYKDFHADFASVTANENIMEIRTKGTYNKAKFTGYINLDNWFKDKVTIHDLDLYLEQFNLTKTRPSNKNNKIKFSEKAKDIDWLVEHGIIKLDKITYERVVMEKLYLEGNLKKNLVTFNMPGIKFADGKVSAKGTFFIPTKSSDIYFSAQNINSNKAADMLLNLQNQVRGYANVSTHVIAENKTEKIFAHTEFNIKDGALTKLGDREFIINKSKKHPIKLSIPKIIRINKEQIKTVQSDIYGTFDVQDEIVKNINIFSEHKNVATFFEGQYNMDTQNAEFYLWGKFNKKAQKGIKVLFLPLSVVTKIIFRPEKTMDLYKDKINKIPDISADKNQIEIFNVRVIGNPNKKSKRRIEFRRLY